MPAITVKNLPEDLYDRLVADPKAHHRSIAEVGKTCRKADP